MGYSTKDTIVLNWCNKHSGWFVGGCYLCTDEAAVAEIQSLRDKIAKLVSLASHLSQVDTLR